MKPKSIFYFLQAFVILLIPACGDEWLNDTTDKTFSVSGLNSTDDMEKLLVGAYFILSNNTGTGGLHEGQQTVNEIMSDNVQLLRDNPDVSDAIVKVFDRQTQEDEINMVNQIWVCGYKLANSASLPISFVEKNGRPADEKSEQMDRILGEAHFLRAFAHFTLVKMFAKPYDASTLNEPGIILKKDASENGEGSALSTVRECYDFIIQDLKKSVGLLPEKYIAGYHPESYSSGGRVKRDAARALLAQVYFHMGQDAQVDGLNAWQWAVSIIDTIVDNPGGIDKRSYSLGQPKDIWLAYEKTPTPDEIIWNYINISWKNQKTIQVFMANKSILVGSTPKNRACPVSQNFIDSARWNKSPIFITDKRYIQLYLPLSPANDKTQGSYFQSLEKQYLWANMFAGYAGLDPTAKYIYSKTTTSDQANINSPMLRMGELRLLRATIFAVTGTGDPKPDMDAVRSKVNIPVKGIYSVQDVINEYRIETAFEGYRVDYLQALRMDLPGGDPAGLHNDIERPAQPWNSNQLVWSIPRNEKIRNTNL